MIAILREESFTKPRCRYLWQVGDGRRHHPPKVLPQAQTHPPKRSCGPDLRGALQSAGIRPTARQGAWPLRSTNATGWRDAQKPRPRAHPDLPRRRKHLATPSHTIAAPVLESADDEAAVVVDVSVVRAGAQPRAANACWRVSIPHAG